ncbi:hypothetical protein ACOI1C_18405 [Bacillus sp. DJP31]|uniref:hypothetical protein n=1 Tax=Bacillus sp. DJP31 TaxID=3409789 RepID=UPI003BB561BC
MIKEVLFVYNAKSGILNGIQDLVHKIVSPKTYPCHLCDLTYGMVGMKSEWRTFVESLPFDVLFLHLDELPTDLLVADYPCVFVRMNDGVRLLISREELQTYQSISEIISGVTSALEHLE